MDPEKFQSMLQERALLREELFRLKECQNFFINLGFTASSVLLAYLSVSGGLTEQLTNLQTEPSINTVYLIPLVVILPIWLIFFDKATTISRIVGYYMLLEEFIKGKNPEQYQGWESSLNLLRSFTRNQEKCIKKAALEKINEEKKIKSKKFNLWEELPYSKKVSYLFRTLFIQRSSINQYRKIVFLGFFMLSVMCLVFSFAPSFLWMIFTGTPFVPWASKHISGIVLVLIFTIIVYIVTKYNLKILYQLARGFHSYAANYALWREILIHNKTHLDEDLTEENCHFPVHWVDRFFPPD